MLTVSLVKNLISSELRRVSMETIVRQVRKRRLEDKIMDEIKMKCNLVPEYET